MQWLRLSAGEVGDRGFERSGIQVSKEQNVSSPITCRTIYSILWEAYVTER